jgi:hypothetical protein
MWLKLAKIVRFSNFLLIFSRFLGRGTHLSTITLKKLDFSKKSKNSIFGQF